jgi:DNA-binding winged helix-turn-helix (wHTH) protein
MRADSSRAVSTDTTIAHLRKFKMSSGQASPRHTGRRSYRVFSGLFAAGPRTKQMPPPSFEYGRAPERSGTTASVRHKQSGEQILVATVSVSSGTRSAPGANVFGTEDGSVAMQNLHAVVSALANHELRQRLQFLIGASLAGGFGGGAGREISPDVESGAVFTGGRAFSFGPFRLLPSQRLLLEGGRRVQIGSRAFDILTVLVDRAGEVVSKDELIDRVWQKIFVDVSNLKTQISALRRVLGEGHAGRRFIVTVPGRGYNFVAQVRFEGPR